MTTQLVGAQTTIAFPAQARGVALEGHRTNGGLDEIQPAAKWPNSHAPSCEHRQPGSLWQTGASLQGHA